MLKEMPMAVDPLPLDTTIPTTTAIHSHYTPLQSKLSRSDVSFPLSTPRRRVPSMASLAGVVHLDGQTLCHLTIRGGASTSDCLLDAHTQDIDMSDSPSESDHISPPQETSMNILDLPSEVQGRILDHIFGDMHSVNAGSTSLRGKSVSSLMRHPRRKAVSDFALVCPLWREMVQERIYRHIKIKGTRPGIQESREYFIQNSHLTRHVRHIEFWVPVWGDKSSLIADQSIALQRQGGLSRALNHAAENDNPTIIDIPGITYPLSIQSATLAEIFQHISIHFPHARVFTLEGGHCKKSKKIEHFSPNRLFEPKFFELLPQIRTFAMRGAWNIMREYQDWENISRALPNVEEWHCGFAKPRVEAEEIINSILIKRPMGIRHVNVSLDGMYSKDPMSGGGASSSGTSAGSMMLGSNGSAGNQGGHEAHLCENLGLCLPDLESVSYTGKICEWMWKAATWRVADERIAEPRLKHLEVVVKSCCRQRVLSVDPVTGEEVMDELGGVMADGAGIGNMTFIRAFERLVLNTVEALRWFPNLHYVRIRFIDLDSPCTLLNPYWLLEKGRVYGVWSEEVVERLEEVRPEVRYVELGEGIETGVEVKSEREEVDGETGLGQAGGAAGSGSGSSVYPKLRPKSIKTSSYKVLAETRLA